MKQNIPLLLNSKVKKPSEAFIKCPSCKAAAIKTIDEVDVACMVCKWNSRNAFEEAGGYDWWETNADIYHMLEETLRKRKATPEEGNVKSQHIVKTAGAW